MTLHVHTLVIVSEHDEYEGEMEAVARDAVHGDAILRSWSKEPIGENALVGDEPEFFNPSNDPDFGEGDTDTEEDRRFAARIEADDAGEAERRAAAERENPYVLNESGEAIPDGAPIAYVQVARPETAERVLSAPIDADGRSPWFWIRLANGDLFLGVAPRGATYESLEGEPGAGWGT